MPDERKSAVLSPCETYRYLLTRRWREGPGVLVFVMLNPSTANATLDDPTLGRCRAFAKRFAFDALQVVNLFALRATDPRELQRHVSPVGDANDAWLERATHEGTPIVVVAWGSDGGRWHSRVRHVFATVIKRPVFCLGTTKSGEPRHPLYVPATQTLVPYEKE